MRYKHSKQIKELKISKLCRKDIPNMRYVEFQHLMLTQPRYMQVGTRHKMKYYEI